MAHSKRHDFKMHYKVGATKDGKLQAVEAQLYADTGPYASLGPYTIFRGIIHTTGPYEVPNVKSDAYCVYTNSPYAGSFRGFGCPQVHFSAESIMDELAEKLSIDPITIRKINMLKPYSRTCTDQPLDASVGLEECIDTAVKKSDFMRKWAEYKKETGRTRKGIGIATFFHGNSLGPEGADACTAYLAIFDDGSVRYRTGITEYGTGAPTGHLMIVAEILGIPVDFIHLERPDTSAVPDGGPTVASRSTVMGGRAAMQAALKVRAALDGMTAQLFNCDPDDVEIRGAVVTCKSDSSKKMTFAELVKKCFENGVGLSTTETYLAPRTFYDEEKGYGSPYLTYTFGAVVAEVEVDMDYGYITVTKVTQAFDCGKAINPLALEGQMEGGCIQGLGYGLMEEVATKEGKILNPNFADYFIPTSLDSGPIETSLIEGYLSPIGPYGAKAMAEPAIDAPAAAVSNAVKHATGVRVKKLPVTPEKVILGVEALKTQSS
jgi:CO/xanthine dehydrogenase Mo-binding subunit